MVHRTIIGNQTIFWSFTSICGSASPMFIATVVRRTIEIGDTMIKITIILRTADSIQAAFMAMAIVIDITLIAVFLWVTSSIKTALMAVAIVVLVTMIFLTIFFWKALFVHTTFLAVAILVHRAMIFCKGLEVKRGLKSLVVIAP